MQVCFADKSDVAAAMQQLTRNYELYKLCFPDPDERETLQKLKLLFLRIPGWRFAWLQDGGHVIAVCQFCRVTPSAAFIEHLFVEPSLRLRRYGSTLLRAVEQRLFAEGVEELYAEMNDAELMTKEEIARDNPDPRERLLFWERQDWLLLDAPYRQPPLVDLVPTDSERALIGEETEELSIDEGAADAATVDYLQIIGKLRDRVGTVSSERFKSAVAGYFQTFLPQQSKAELDSCYLEIAAKLSGLSDINLVPIGSRRIYGQLRNPPKVD